jgi:FKBP-type peptidyl-prolyl cis-trans isomerase
MRWVLAGMALGLLAGCAPKPPPPPEEPELTEAEEWRVRYFGEKLALDKTIAWRASGLGIRVLTPGSGTPPKPTDTVRVHYTGRLKNGTVFDDTRAAGKPADFKVNQLIPGWSAAMPTLQPGSRAEIFVPPHLGYGGLQAGRIPPNSGLIFDVELITVNP